MQQSTVSRWFNAVMGFVGRVFTFWRDDMRRRRSCLGKGLSLAVGLFVIMCACSLPFAIVQSAGETVGVLPTRTPRPPTATLGPTNTPQPTRTPAPTDTPRPTQTPRPTHTPRPTLVPGLVETNQAINRDRIATAESVGAYPCKPGQYKGNQNSGIYHAPGQRDYEKTQTDVACFDTMAEAEAAGFRIAER